MKRDKLLAQAIAKTLELDGGRKMAPSAISNQLKRGLHEVEYHLHLLESAGYVSKDGSSFALTWAGHEYVDGFTPTTMKINEVLVK